jgi:CheY-like chemotaxis protein/signal transduction histidine kinase/HAMP domain-containing protein
MKLKDLKIGAQLRIGLGIIMAFVIFLGALAWLQTDQLWLQTKGLYDHPLQVRRALDKLTIDILSMHRDMKDLILAENEQERQTLIQDLDVSEADALQQFDILYDRYLGPRKDIDEARNHFVQWKSIRADTFRLLRAGKIAEAAARTKSSGIGGGHVEKIFKEVQNISDFAKNKGDQFYLDATATNDTLNRRLGVIVAVILLLSLIVAWLLLKGIKTPLAELTSAADRFSRGELDARSRYASANEFGTLAAAFNALAETVRTEWWSRESAARIAAVMLQEEDLHAFCRELLKSLLEHTGSQIGAVYLLNGQKTEFDHFESIGLAPAGRASFSAAGLEGEFGAALATGKIQRLTDIPAESRFTFATVGGDFQPREIITIPIPGNGGIAAVISLAGVRSYPAPAVQLVNDVWSVMTARLNGVLASGKIRAFAERLEQQNMELQSQQEELEAQAGELTKQTEELQEQNAELEQQRLAVEEANRLKSQFLSNMSHELRTPLNSVMALSRVLMMQAKAKLSAEEVNYLEIIERNGKNLLTLINDILDLAKIEAGRMDVNPNPFSLRMTLEDILESIAPLAAENQIELRQEIPDNLPPLESDELRVTQILQNLIGNAVKFTAAGSVTVSVASDQGKVSVRIADTGIGIAENDLPYIFDEFRQVDGTSARRHEGTGLGLAIARKAARMLGGDIAVQSAPGKGSTFTVTLPLIWQGKAPVYEPIVLRQPQAVKSKRKTILVVDDEPEMAAMISRYLLQEGYNTLTATSGAEALELAARELPFAITLDIIMPDMDGWEVLQGLKKNIETKEIPVIIVSISEDRGTGFALGAVGYVTKPVSRKLLVSEIGKIGKPGTRSIMIVDDNDLDRQQIRRIIEEEGLKPIVAEDGAACLELIQKQVPDVLVLDLMMPEPDGFAVLERIRGNPETRDLPVIVVTAKDLTEEDRKKLSGNVFSVLEKSAATSATLLVEIKRILQGLENLPKHPGLKKPAAPPRILIVDDNEAVIIQVKSVLKAVGYIADVARGGQEAFDYVSHTIPDGIVLDLMMPEIDGFAVLEKIRGTKATVKIPVLILTAKDLTPEDFKKLSANHIQQLVQKGDVDRESLLSKVRAMLGISEFPARLDESAGGKSGSFPVALERRREVKPHPIERRRKPDASKDAVAPGTLRTPAILIVEDNADNMTTIKALLQNRYRILEATDGEEGLRMGTEARPDLILLDMALPKMDGFTVVRHLKEDKALSHIPVIALTAQVMKGDREKILEAGCDDYIAKPVEPESFLKKIGEWLKG